MLVKKSVIVDGIRYVLPNNKAEAVVNPEGLPYVIIRTYSAGVHMGYLRRKEYTLAGIVVELVNTRRIWSWSGAFTLTDLAVNGTNAAKDCKFTIEAPSIEMVAIEIIVVTEEGFTSLNNVESHITK